MGFLDRLLGRAPSQQQRQSGHPTWSAPSASPHQPPRPGASEDERTSFSRKTSGAARSAPLVV